MMLASAMDDATVAQRHAGPRAWLTSLRLRHPADWRSLLWLVLAVTTAWASWTHPALRPYLLPLGIYFSVAVGLIAHAHNHCPMFASRGLNEAVNVLAGAFFGFPTFVWIAGHNRIHHELNNAHGDTGVTWRLSHRNNLLTAIAGPLYSMLAERPVVTNYLADVWRTERRQFWVCIVQILVWVTGVTVGVLADGRAFLWAFALPWLGGLFLIHFFNYVQHVHCDPFSAHSHSRNWSGRWLNFLLFNQGFHTVHHERPGVHWSRWRALHERFAHRIPAELVSDNLAVWLVRQYVLAPFWPGLGTHQLGKPPWERHPDERPQPRGRRPDHDLQVAATKERQS